MLKTKKSKIIAAGIAGVLAVSAAGIGAVTTLTTTIAGNKLTVQKATLDEENPATGGALLQVKGDPIAYTFDGTKVHDTVSGSWTLRNIGDAKGLFSSELKVADDGTDAVKGLIELEYGTVDGGSTVWHDAGTLLDPETYEESVGLSPAELDFGKKIDIPVRMTLHDPTQIPGNVGDPDVTVNADFVVSYVDAEAGQ